jgi:hypothetical protein
VAAPLLGTSLSWVGEPSTPVAPVEPSRVRVRPFVGPTGSGWSVSVDGKAVLLTARRELAYRYRSMLVGADGERT